MWALLNLIPGISSLVQTITTAWFNSKVQMYQSKTGRDRDVAIQAIQAEVENNHSKVGWITALAGNPVMMFVVVGFSLPWIVYEWKVVIWDNIICLWLYGVTGFTPTIKGLVADWAGVILGGIFITSTGVGIAHMVINKD